MEKRLSGSTGLITESAAHPTASSDSDKENYSHCVQSTFNGAESSVHVHSATFYRGHLRSRRLVRSPGKLRFNSSVNEQGINATSSVVNTSIGTSFPHSPKQLFFAILSDSLNMGNVASKRQPSIRIDTLASASKPAPSSSSPNAQGSASPPSSASPITPLDGTVLPGVSSSDAEAGRKFILLDKSIDEPRPLKVVVIGAGFSGIMCGIRCVLLFVRHSLSPLLVVR